jgi:hypothetical protein
MQRSNHAAVVALAVVSLGLTECGSNAQSGTASEAGSEGAAGGAEASSREEGGFPEDAASGIEGGTGAGPNDAGPDAGATDAGTDAATDALLIICGYDYNIVIVDLGVSGTQAPTSVWSWSGNTDPTIIGLHLTTDYDYPDDCKAVDANAHILVTASNDGVALIDRQTQAVLFYATVANAHSADVLSNNRILVASSVGGDRIVLFDAAQDNTPIWSAPFFSAHGIVWDEKRQIVWALGSVELDGGNVGAAILREYSLVNWSSTTPSLQLQNTYTFADNDGHDLQPHLGTSDLYVSTANNVWTFNRDTHAIAPLPSLADQVNVKSVSTNEVLDRTVYVQPAPSDDFASVVGVVGDSPLIIPTKSTVYKARWIN